MFFARRLIAVSLSVLLTLTLVVSAFAAPRVKSGFPSLRIDNNTAYCMASYRCGDSSTDISLTLILKQGSTVVDSWNATGKSFVTLSKEKRITAGKHYTLTLSVKLNGVQLPEQSVTATS